MTALIAYTNVDTIITTEIHHGDKMYEAVKAGKKKRGGDVAPVKIVETQKPYLWAHDWSSTF